MIEILVGLVTITVFITVTMFVSWLGSFEWMGDALGFAVIAAIILVGAYFIGALMIDSWEALQSSFKISDVGTVRDHGFKP